MRANRFKGRGQKSLFAAAGAVLLSPLAVGAVTYTWIGGGTDSLWSNPANWNGGVVAISSSATDIIFGSATPTNPNQDIRNNFAVQSLKFTNTKYTSAGFSITMSGNALIQTDIAAAISNPLSLSSNTTITGAGNTLLLGVIDDAGGLIKNGTGVLTLSAANTFTGATQINAGQLNITNGAALQNSTVSINVNNGLGLGGLASATLGNLTGAGSWNLDSAYVSIGANNSTAPAYTGTITGIGTGGLQKIGSGVLSLGGVGSSFNTLNVNDGSLLLRGGSLTLNSLILAFHPSMTVQEGATLDTRAVGGAIQGSIANPSTLTITGAGSRWRAGSIIVGGAGVDGGALVVDAGGAITDATSLTVQAWTKFTSTALATVLIQNGGTMTVAASFLGAVGQYAGAATVTGAGSLWTNTDRLELGHAPFVNSPGTGRVTVANGGAVVTVGETKFLNPTSSITVDGGTYTTGTLWGDSGSIDLTAPSSLLTINAATGASTFSGSFTGAGNLIKSGGSTQVLNGALSYTGITTVNAGTLNLSSGASHTFIVNGGTLQVPYGDLGTRSFKANVGGTILYQTNSISGGFLRGSGFHDLSAITRVEGTSLGSDVLIDQSSPITMINVTNAGSLNSTASLTLDGFLLTSAGKLDVNAAATVEAFESNGQLTIGKEGTVNNIGNDMVLGGGSRTFIGAAKSEGGTLLLRDRTTLQLNGALLVNNGTIDGPTNVNFGSLAKGAGRYGEVNVTDGGKFSPGNSPGTVTTGATTWNSGGGYLVELGNASHDLWQVNGELKLNSSPQHPFTIALASLDDLVFDNSHDDSWMILHAYGSLINLDPAALALDISQFKSDLGGGHFSLQTTPNDIIVNFSAVPEPGTMSAFAIAVLGSLLRIRRKA